jgi:FAD/FMN-containing dehydrogenase
MPYQESWGRYFNFSHRTVTPLWRNDQFLFDATVNYLPFGLGRSYGDSCLNGDGVLISSNQLNHFIFFDVINGILRCEAGVSFAQILDVIVARGWFLPVTPGTKFVTMAGAIANDVHGKNHTHAGTIGCHVTQFELLKSNGSRFVCSPDNNRDLFNATIGGLGLTGFITWVELKLIPVRNAFIQEESIQCKNLDQMLDLFAESDKDYQYTVSWIDCLAKGKQLGRGVFTRGNHCTNTVLPKTFQPRPKRSVPFVFPSGCLNRLSVSAFNQLYYRKLLAERKSSRIDYDRFFYPLDAIHHWNRLYGPRGFIQYQCVLVNNGCEAMKELLQRIASSGQPSPLNVLKEFGDVKSPGMLSFPRKGLTLALDFPNRGQKTLELCNELDEVVKQAGGALYPAKDSRMSAELFAASFSQLNEFKKYIDPAFSSSFWRRVQP